MHVVNAHSIDEAYIRCLKLVLHGGALTHPRGFTCWELSPCTVNITFPNFNVLINPIRKASRTFMAAELIWILTGSDQVDMISFYNSRISKFSDDGKVFFGAYGPKVVAQLKYVIDTLVKDQWSRQAIINIWRENPAPTKDVPCTISLHFIQRPIGYLNLVVYMRSQDLWLGFPYDVHNFTSLQNIVASMLNIKLGTFTLIQGSLHLYQDNRDAAIEASYSEIIALKSTPNSTIKGMNGFIYEAMALVESERRIRMNIAPGPYLSKCPLIQQKLDWLYIYARKKHETNNH